MRFCHCTGYLNNPGGICCQELTRMNVAVDIQTAAIPVIAKTAEQILERWKILVQDEKKK